MADAGWLAGVGDSLTIAVNPSTATWFDVQGGSLLYVDVSASRDGGITYKPERFDNTRYGSCRPKIEWGDDSGYFRAGIDHIRFTVTAWRYGEMDVRHESVPPRKSQYGCWK